MSLETVAILSPGDMGHTVGRVLVEHGLRVITCLKERSQRTRSLAESAGILDVPTFQALVSEADIILFDTPGMEKSFEFPKNLRSVAQSICAKDLGMTSIYSK